MLMAQNPIKSMKKASILSYLVLVFVLSLAFWSCDEENPFRRIPYDFSTVPAAYDTTAALERIELDQGLVVFIIERGSDDDTETLTRNDLVELFYTGRFTDGEIFDSSYRDGDTRPLISSVNGFIDGFSFGLIGGTPGEKRTIVIPPVYGYQDGTTANNTGRILRGETLIFDVEIVSIPK